MFWYLYNLIFGIKITGYLAFLIFGSVDIWTCACNPEWEEGAIGWLEYELPRQPSFLIVIAHWRTGKILPRQWNFANSSVLASLITNPFSSWIYQRIIVRLLFSADFKCLDPYFFLQESGSLSTLACNTFVMFKLCRGALNPWHQNILIHVFFICLSCISLLLQCAQTLWRL